MKNWRTTMSGVTTLVIGIGLAYVTVMVIPWGQFPPEFPSELKTGLMSALMLGAIGLITSGIQGVTARDQAAAEHDVQQIHANHEANAQRITHVAAEIARVEEQVARVPEVATHVAQRTAEEVAAEVAKEKRP